jgi:signal transduction histidine kinase
VGYPLGEIDEVIDKLISSFFLLIPVTLILLVSGGLLITWRYMLPLRELKHYANELVHQPLDEELKTKSGSSKDEFGQLISIINEIVQNMRANIKQALSFSALSSHELRTPLAIIRNELENALDEKLPRHQAKKLLVSIYDEILSLTRVVDVLLNLSIMQAGTFKLNLQLVDLCNFLQEFREEATVLALEKNISVEVQNKPNFQIEIDVELIRQTLFNLLDNALKYTPERGLILIKYYIKDTDVIFTFADTGAGISKDILPRIFDLFYKGDVGLSGSTGLGLTLVRWIIHQHSGSIDVKSNEGSGTIFTIRLPLLHNPTCD